MPVRRHFLGWDATVTTLVRDFVLPGGCEGPVDLEKMLIVVPTRQAGRRLREALARRCAQWNTALLSPRVVTPTFFLHSDEGPGQLANPALVMAYWAGLLLEAGPERFTGLFPGGGAPRDFARAVQIGCMIEQLRDNLADGARRLADVPAHLEGLGQELRRWEDLIALEESYLAKLEALGLKDPIEGKLASAESPVLPWGTEQIIVAALPDPTPLMIRAVERLSGKVPVEILLHAPPSLADHFDDWGRPVSGKWRHQLLEIPDAKTNVLLAASPAAQSRKVLELMASEVARFGPADLAIGVPDREVTLYLAAELEDRGLPSFDPAGKAMSAHPLYLLLERFHELLQSPAYNALSAFLRHTDVLKALEDKFEIPPNKLLEELDRFQNRRLPLGLEEFRCLLEQEGQPGPGLRPAYSNLAAAIRFLDEGLGSFKTADFGTALRKLLHSVYEEKELNQGNPEDGAFITVAQSVDTALCEFEHPLFGRLGLGSGQALMLLLRRLRDLRYYPEGEEGAVDLEGWLELPWSDAPFLVITGMNEGFVPDGKLGDAFLPDSLRRRLGLRGDKERLARDAFIMKGLMASRREAGRICFIAGKTSGAGEPLRPSRLLFRCGDAMLLELAKKLFDAPGEERDSFPPTVSFTLDARPPGAFDGKAPWLNELYVTDFRRYLACPFRFYLHKILGMEALSDEKAELDSMDFGGLMHHALQRMAQDEALRRCGDARALHDFLCTEVTGWGRRRFGLKPPLQVEIQLEAAKRRLRAAADLQAGMVQEGWEIVAAEISLEGVLQGMPIRGKIDRIDQHRQSKRLRILDYKTSDNGQAPAAVHLGQAVDWAPSYALVRLGNKEKSWRDLQLPLYRILLAGRDGLQGPFEMGFFNLPKAAGGAGLERWDDFNEGLMQSAEACAQGVVADILNRRFWPPAEKLQYDDYGDLFHGGITRCIDGEAFQAYLREGAR